MATRSLPLLPGYELLERLGRGAGAVINLARENASRKLVAIKHVIRQDDEDDKFLAQAENEYEVGRQIEHAFLRRCFEIVRVRKWLKLREVILVMEYVDGERLEEHRPDDLRRTIAIFKQIAEGLQALHAAGFVHCDIKPNNIMLRPDGGLKIIDFGQSCRLGAIKERIQGTPDYIAPEQVLRKEIDQRTDVFNLGATMYWMLTGKFFKTMLANVTASPTARREAIESKRGNQPAHELNPQVPTALSALVGECCETAKERRPRDMRALLERLDTVGHVLDLRHKRKHVKTVVRRSGEPQAHRKQPDGG